VVVVAHLLLVALVLQAVRVAVAKQLKQDLLAHLVKVTRVAMAQLHLAMLAAQVVAVVQVQLVVMVLIAGQPLVQVAQVQILIPHGTAQLAQVFLVMSLVAAAVVLFIQI
jgi:hypothetical protein